MNYQEVHLASAWAVCWRVRRGMHTQWHARAATVLLAACMESLQATSRTCWLPCHHCLQVYQPLELLLFIAALCTLADAYVPSLIAVPKVWIAKAGMNMGKQGVGDAVCVETCFRLQPCSHPRC